MSQSEYRDDGFTAGWFIWLVRIGLLAVTAFTLWGAVRIEHEFRISWAPDFRSVAPSFWQMVGLFAAAGAAFGLAVRIPFPRPRVAFGRIVVVIVGLAPAIHWWLVWVVRPGGSVLSRHAFWFDDVAVVQVGAALAGVGLASAIGARRARR
jgi:hypothetical protein